MEALMCRAGLLPPIDVLGGLAASNVPGYDGGVQTGSGISAEMKGAC